MNWAKKLLTAGDCPRCGGRLEDLGDGQVSCDTCTYPEPEEDERIVCDVCDRIIDNDGEYPTCPVCGVALCGNEECANRHIAEHHPEWNDEDEDDEAEDDEAEDDPPRCCDYCGRDIDPDANWMLDTRDGTEHFCCAECQHERAAEIEAAPLCGWCHEKCDQGVVHLPDSSVPFCSTDCAAKFQASSATGHCDDCERDGRCDDCPGHPGGVPVDPHDPENVPFTPFHAGLGHDRFFLESDFGKTSTPLIATTGWRVARRDGKTYCPAVDGTVWCEEDGYWKKCPFRWSHLAPTEAAQEDMPFTPVKPMTELDQAYLASSFHKYSCRAAFIDAFGNRYVLFRNDDGQEVWPAKDGSLWVLTNDLQWVKLTAYWRNDYVSKHSNPFDS